MDMPGHSRAAIKAMDARFRRLQSEDVELKNTGQSAGCSLQETANQASTAVKALDAGARQLQAEGKPLQLEQYLLS